MKYLITAILLLILCINVSAIFHSYKFTHFSDNLTEKTESPSNLSWIQKIKILIFGVDNPKPKNQVLPILEYKSIKIKSNREIEGWLIDNHSSKGTVILYHGYSGDKSKLLENASIFHQLGYSVFLIDFMGSGGSEGYQTTIGYYEAEQVRDTYNYILNSGESKIYLFGTSMGAVAMLKAIHDYQFNPSAIIIECPFGSMLETVSARFNEMNVPAFPMANLLLFWGGILNNFNAFDHNPTEYAKKITCPTLLLYGEKDKKVSISEIDEIFKNLDGDKSLVIYPEAGHENYLNLYKSDWKKDVEQFLSKN